jgi:hypothetical protein
VTVVGYLVLVGPIELRAALHQPLQPWWTPEEAVAAARVRRLHRLGDLRLVALVDQGPVRVTRVIPRRRSSGGGTRPR